MLKRSYLLQVIPQIVKKSLLLVIKFYQLCLSPFVGQHCRFYPTCSCYATEAIQQLGVLKGCWLSLKRLSHCHPWHHGGYDPVPKATQTPSIIDV